MLSQIEMNACTVVEGIAFEVANKIGTKTILAHDLYNTSNKASFTVRGHELVLSVSSFREPSREQALMEAVRINSPLLIDEVYNA